MKLHEKLEQLRNDAGDYDHDSDELQDGFARCIEDAELLEYRNGLCGRLLESLKHLSEICAQPPDMFKSHNYERCKRAKELIEEAEDTV